MTTRRVLSGIAAVAAAIMVAVALFGFVRIRQLDAEAERIGRLWAEDRGNTALVEESNESYTAARELEEQLPLGPIGLAGLGLLTGAAAIALWPQPSEADHSDDWRPDDDLATGR